MVEILSAWSVSNSGCVRRSTETKNKSCAALLRYHKWAHRSYSTTYIYHMHKHPQKQLVYSRDPGNLRYKLFSFCSHERKLIFSSELVQVGKCGKPAGAVNRPQQ